MTQEFWQATDEMLRRRLPAGHLPVRLVGIGLLESRRDVGEGSLRADAAAEATSQRCSQRYHGGHHRRYLREETQKGITKKPL